MGQERTSVGGLVVEWSASTSIRYFVYGVLGTTMGSLFIYAWAVDRADDGNYGKLGGLVMGIVAIAVSIGFAAYQIRESRLQQRIVLGRDRYQMVKVVDGVDVVVAEVPYANIHEVKRLRTAHGVQVDIRLIDPLDSDTLRPPSNNPIAPVECDAFSCPIPNGFKLRPYRIADELERAIRQWREASPKG